MNQSIQPVRLDAAAPPTIVRDIEGVFDRIRQRAYDLFKMRGFSDGGDLDDWLRAERDLFAVPLSELKESEREYNLELSAPGFEPSEIQVAVEPGSVTIRGKSERKREHKGEKTVYSEWAAKELFRHFDLATAVDPDAVKAGWEDGVLRVSLPKETAKTASSGALAAA